MSAVFIVFAGRSSRHVPEFGPKRLNLENHSTWQRGDQLNTIWSWRMFSAKRRIKRAVDLSIVEEMAGAVTAPTA
jgi:hypothetical protein